MAESEGITTQYSNTVGDYIRADLRYSAVKDPRFRLGAVVLAGFAAYSLITDTENWWIGAILFALAIAGWFGVLSANPARALRAVKQNPGILGPYVITFSEDGIHLSRILVGGRTAKTEDRHFAWSQFTRVLETGRLFIFVSRRIIYPVVPKSAFKREQIDQIRQLLRRHTSRLR